MKKAKVLLLALVLALSGMALIGAGCKNGGDDKKQTTVKLGYFPNITHSQALVGTSNGKFQESLGSDVKLDTKTFNAGPTEIEALFAGEIDLGYIGPSPAVNGYIKSNGESLRIISGATSGAAVLVLQKDLAEQFKKDGAKALEGKKIASPQQGNTQDISLRHYIKDNNLKNVEIVPIANADQLTMFSQKQLDGSWAPEPWGARLVKEADGVIAIDERTLWPNKKFCVANVIVSTKFLEEHPDLVKRFLQAHVDLTDWINENPIEAQRIVNTEIEKLTTKKIAEDVLASAWERMDVTVNPLKDTVTTFSGWAFDAGFLGDKKPDLSNLYDLNILNEITGQKY